MTGWTACIVTAVDLHSKTISSGRKDDMGSLKALKLKPNCAASQALCQNFRSPQPISRLLRGENLQFGICGGGRIKCVPTLQSRFPTAFRLGSRREDTITVLQKGRLVVGRRGKSRGGGVNGLRKVEEGEREGTGRFVEGEETTAVAGQEEKEKEAPLIDNMADLLNLEKQFAFYGAYHSNKLNVLIHMFFVWPIYFTIGILWAYTPAIVPLPLPGGTLPFQQYMILNVNFIIAGIYSLYYAALDKKAGSLGAAICLGCWIGSQAIAQVLPWSTAWKVVLLSQVICWTSQILGHSIFEGRAPALLDNLPQAFFMAPFFVLLEFLQSFFGYEPYPGFRKIVEGKCEENIALWKAEKGKKAA